MSEVTRRQVVEILGALNDEQIAKIIDTGASVEEVVEARAWLDRDDYLGRELQRSLSGRVAAVFEILRATEPAPEERER